MKKILFVLGLISGTAQSQKLTLDTYDQGLRLSWERQFPDGTGVESQIVTRVLSSSDLVNWVEETTITSEEIQGDGISNHDLLAGTAAKYYRIEETVQYRHRSSDSAQPASYDLQLQNTRQKLQSSSIQSFVNSATDTECSESIGWDPRSATFWTEYNTTPEDHNASLPADDPKRRLSDFTLNEEELALFLKNGFVVSEGIGSNYNGFDTAVVRSANPVDYYYSIWADDLPVYVTADSVLDAWHKTFLAMLEEMEELYLGPMLHKILASGLGDLNSLYGEWVDSETAGAGGVRQAIRDLDLYLGVASRLNRGGTDSYKLIDSGLVDNWYQAAIEASNPMKYGLYGDEGRSENMSLYKIRGHYVNSHALGAYFQSLLWLSRMQFHLASPDDLAQEKRELRAAVLLSLLVKNSSVLSMWDELENMMQLLVGQSDAMTIREMIALLESQGITSVNDIASDSKMVVLREALLSTSYGIQEINGGQHEAAMGDAGCDELRAPLPRALSLFGQRWTPDAWAFNKLVVPNVRDNQDKTLHRRKPSGLDVMYSVLGNDSAAPILGERMLNQEGVWLRDGIPFQNELRTVRNVMDGQSSEFWTEHIYGSWLYTLRALSPTVSNGPDTFCTPAWKNRMMNAQLASWTHLRHDTFLYAEQSFTPPLTCEFPDGYVEPYPEFWQRLSDMALSYKSALGKIEIEGDFRVEKRGDEFGWRPFSEENYTIRWNANVGYTHSEFPTPGNEVSDETTVLIDRGSRSAVICEHLEIFSNCCLQLKRMADTQLAGNPHSENDSEFIRALVEDAREVGYIGERLYSGWFPNLYLKSIFSINTEEHPSAVWSPVVVDVHTDSLDTLCTGDPGGVLHEGVGYAQFMMVAVKHPDGSSCVFGGPVLNHYEFWTDDPATRLNNAEWKAVLELGNAPPQASWKKSFRVAMPREE